MSKELEKAIFAGGCFWCIEAAFQELDGVDDAINGYIGGKSKNPTYYSHEGYREAVKILYHPDKISYEKLLNVFWSRIQPTDAGGQFTDRGHSYTTAIYYLNDEQKKAAKESKKVQQEKYYEPIATEILSAGEFYDAEEDHQDYYLKQRANYHAFKVGSGREAYFAEQEGEEEDEGGDGEDLKEKLTPMQYNVTQSCGTEPPFQNEYWDNKREGIYVDVVSGEPLFSSVDKFESGTGWPSFKKPLEKGNVTENSDKSLGMERTEVKSKGAGSHLGHVFDDGPGPTGQRYCINSAALKFIPKEDLEKEGYEKYLKLFE